MIGEIRDEETAHIAVRAAITGHLVLSTLHTNNALESIVRLKDMGIEGYFMEDALIGIISQRLVRKICPYCKTKYMSSYKEMKELNFSFPQELYKGKGCIKCNYTGYKGRRVVYEIVRSEDIEKGCLKDNIFNIKKVISQSNTVSIRHNCRELVKLGITTYEEFLRLNF